MTVYNSSIQPITKKVCSNDASHTTTRWHKDPNDRTRDLCRRCYEAGIAQNQKAAGRVCSNGVSHTTKQWKKDPNDKTRDLCQSCYKTALAQKQKAEGRVCGHDASHTSKQWLKDPNDKTRYLCKNCYNTALTQKQKAEGKACSNDASHMISRWHKDPHDKTRGLCESCYKATFAQKRKADRKRKREEPNPKSSKDVASQSISAPPLKRKRVEEEVSPNLSTSEVSLDENQHSPSAEIIEQASLYGDVEHLFLPSIHDSSVFPRANAQQTEPSLAASPAPSGAGQGAGVLANASFAGWGLSDRAESVATRSPSLPFGESPPFEGGVLQFMGETSNPGTTENQPFQANAHRVRENRQSSDDIGSDESGLFGFPDGLNDSSSVATTHEQLPETPYLYNQFVSDNYYSINQTSLNYLPDNNHDSL